MSRVHRADATLSQLMFDAKARQCPRCGAHAMLRAATPPENALSGDGLESSVAGSVWFCFECGHDETTE
jgi:hypothetical protein